MSRRARRRRKGPHGLVPVDKPAGPTSFSVMRDVQRRLDAGRAGHGGTLDPAATGVLVVLLGEATKLSAWTMDWDKVYRARIRLGVATDTLDAEGRVVAESPVAEDATNPAVVAEALRPFVGEVWQVPPIYSALKQGGRTLMSRARAGEEPTPEARQVVCHGAELLDVGPETLDVRLHCGKGYYVRSFARDLGEALGCPAHLEALRRERVGPWSVARCLPPEEVDAGSVVSLEHALPDLPRVALDPDRARAVSHGHPVEAEVDGDRAMLLDVERTPLAIGVRAPDGRFRVARGFRFE